MKAAQEDKFWDDNERQINKKMIKDINDKIKLLDEQLMKEIHETKTETNIALKLSKSEKEERALLEIFSFYARLHKNDLKDF